MNKITIYVGDFGEYPLPPHLEPFVVSPGKYRKQRQRLAELRRRDALKQWAKQQGEKWAQGLSS